MRPRIAVPLAVAIGTVAVAIMTVVGGVELEWAALIGLPVVAFALLWLLSPVGAEPVWAPLPDPSARATEHLATSLASRLVEATEYPSRFRTRLQPRLARLALVKLRRAGIQELSDPRAPAVLGAELHRLVTDPAAILPGPARSAALFATLDQDGPGGTPEDA
ncbi:MAG TPA: hypothetical protein VGJ95_24880 [Pseudonocardiaceae bacterium]